MSKVCHSLLFGRGESQHKMRQSLSPCNEQPEWEMQLTFWKLLPLLLLTCQVSWVSIMSQKQPNYSHPSNELGGCCLPKISSVSEMCIPQYNRGIHFLPFPLVVASKTILSLGAFSTMQLLFINQPFHLP